MQFGVYGTWWFALLNLLLAVNIFCAAAIRYPWKRHQTGFVITHIGLLTLLFGCLMQRRGGIDAQMPIFEGQIGHRAFEDTHHFQLAIQKKGSTSRKPEVISIPFTAGPFNWEDYTGRLVATDCDRWITKAPLCKAWPAASPNSTAWCSDWRVATEAWCTIATASSWKCSTTIPIPPKSVLRSSSFA